MAGEWFSTVSQLCRQCNQGRGGLNEHKILVVAQNRIKDKGRIIRGNDDNLFFSSEIIDLHWKHNYGTLRRLKERQRQRHGMKTNRIQDPIIMMFL